MADHELLGREMFLPRKEWDDAQGDCGVIHASHLRQERYGPDEKVYLGGSNNDFASSDYSGATYTLANHKVFMERFEELCGKEWWPVIGNHSYTDIVFAPTAADVPEIREVLEGLRDYPIVEDDAVSEVEEEIAHDAWKNYGRRDFQQWLAGNAPNEWQELDDDGDAWTAVIDNLSDEQVDSLWYHALSEGRGEEVTYEHLTAIFHFDRAVERRDLEDDIRRLYEEDPFEWGAVLAYRLSRFRIFMPPSDLGARITRLQEPVRFALFNYLREQVPRLQVDPLHPQETIDEILKLTLEWTGEIWSILLDAMEEEGPAAFDPRGAARRLLRDTR